MAISVNDASHLLRRAGFGASVATATTFAQSVATRAAAVERVLDLSANPPAPRPDIPVDNSASWDHFVLVRQMWMERMQTVPNPLEEKIALFWHGHFAIQNPQVIPSHDRRQVELLRQHALGPLNTLLKTMALDPAMLIFLNGFQSWKERPNQNFARELFELYTLGVGNYTLTDVREAARAWTGHGVTWSEAWPLSYQFHEDGHDTDNKTIFGITKNWDGPDILDELTNGVKRSVTARWIATKLWTFLAYPNPAPAVIDDLVVPYKQSGLETKTLVRAIFNHPQFWSDESRLGLVRSPVEWVVAALARTNLLDPNGVDFAAAMGQALLAAPSVAGWKPNAYWLSPSTYWIQGSFARYVAETLQPYHANNSGTFLHETLAMSVPDAVNRAFDVFGIDRPSSRSRAIIETMLRAERTSTTRGDPGSGQLWKLIYLMLMTPDFRLA
jgi:uncharacterized protein (DUF1800 family)